MCDFSLDIIKLDSHDTVNALLLLNMNSLKLMIDSVTVSHVDILQK